MRRPRSIRGVRVRSGRPVRTAPTQQRRRGPPRGALRRGPRRGRGIPAPARHHGHGRPDRLQRSQPRPTLGVLPGAVGDAVRARLLPPRQGLRPTRLPGRGSVLTGPPGIPARELHERTRHRGENMTDAQALEPSVPWQRIEATDEDWDKAEPALLTGMLSQLVLIRAFEEYVLELAAA